MHRNHQATRRGSPQRGRAGQPVRMFAAAVPGLAPLLIKELDALQGVHVTDNGFDGRSDVVVFTAEPRISRRIRDIRLAEDIFVEAGRTLRADGDRSRWITTRIWKPDKVRRALDARASLGVPDRARPTFRVIVRVLQEKSFLRTDLRRELLTAIGRDQPTWRPGDPAQVEVWAVEYQHGKILAGLRASSGDMRQHDGRSVERRGALRPTVAAAMVHLAGRPSETLLDPCCGSGTILQEASDIGWVHPTGIDIDPDAVRTARRNAPDSQVSEGDARQIALPDGAVDAIVSNLPFGQQYGVDEDMTEWLRKVLAEFVRLVKSGGRVVLLTPTLPRAAQPEELVLASRTPIRILGTKATIWSFSRE